MVNFGFPAFLRILFLNEKPQRREILQRLGPSSGGFDFHTSLRSRIRRYLVDGEAMSAVIASAAAIKQQAERESAISALERLEAWYAPMKCQIEDFSSATFISPRRLFKIRFEPVFGLRIAGRTAAMHVWNTKTVTLAPGLTYAALALVAHAYREKDDGPDDVGLLSLREPARAYYLSDVPEQSALAASIVERFENIIQGPPTAPQPEERPAP